MEYQNVDEAARKEACERVKQIAEAIKRIRKKYYLCFNKISDSDKQRYDQLVDQMQSVAGKNGLEKLTFQLMSEINVQFGENIPEADMQNGKTGKSLEDLYKKFLAGAKLQAEFTRQFKKTGEPAYLRRATQIQNHLRKISKALENNYGRLELRAEKARVMSRTFVGQVKEAMYTMCGKSYKETRNSVEKDNLAKILGLYPYSNVHMNPLNRKAEPLGRG